MESMLENLLGAVTLFSVNIQKGCRCCYFIDEKLKLRKIEQLTCSHAARQ